MTPTPHLPAAAAPFALLREMAETPAHIRGFDPGRVGGLREIMARHGKLFVTGEGSSRIFPAKNLIACNRSRRRHLAIETEGARQAAECIEAQDMVIGLSNSGRTRETVSLFETLAARGQDAFAITQSGDSPLARMARGTVTLSCGAEQAVAASKSVVEQALLLQALLDGPEFADLDRAADAFAGILAAPVPAAVADSMAGARTLYVAGRNTGSAEEIALKACEITRVNGCYLEGTYVLHGIEEVMTQDDCVLLVEPFPAEMDRYRSVLEQGVGLKVIAISSEDTPFPTIRIPRLDGFDGYLQLAAGWSLLAAAGQLRGVDLDKTARARKVGNAVD